MLHLPTDPQGADCPRRCVMVACLGRRRRRPPGGDPGEGGGEVSWRVHGRSAPTRRALGAGILVGTGAALAACAPGGGRPADGGSGAAGGTGPAPVTVLTFNNPLFQQAKDDLLAVLPEADPGLQPDLIVFPGQINEFRTKVLAIYAGG